MHIEDLQHFQEVVELKSISKVATRSQMSQSALSQMIQKLEDSLGYKLLQRSNRGVEPTEMGKIVLKYSGLISKTYEKMQQEMQDLDKRIHTIRINADKPLVSYSMPCALYKIKNRFPENKYELYSSSAATIAQEVREDLCDMGVTYERPVADDLQIRRIGGEKIVLVAAASFEVPNHLNFEQLGGYDLVALSDARYITKPLKSELSKYGFKESHLNILFEVDAVSGVKTSISNGFGMAFLPHSAVRKELAAGEYKEVVLENANLSHEIYLISKSRALLPSAVGETVDCFIDLGEALFT